MSANHSAEPQAGRLAIAGQQVELHIHQFVGLVWLLRFNCEMTATVGDATRQQWGAMNALLACYATLEALILESAILVMRQLYDERRWRLDGLVPKFERYLREAGREQEAVPSFVGDIADLRSALTHSEPDNPRIARLNQSIHDLDATRYFERTQEVAHWLWQGAGPPLLARAFEGRPAS